MSIEGNTMKNKKNTLREFKEVWNNWKGFISEADNPSYNVPFALNAISQKIKKGFEELPGFQEMAARLAETSGSSRHRAVKKEVGEFMKANMPKVFQQMAIGGEGSPAKFIASQEGILGKEGVGYAVAKGLQQVEVPGLSAEQSSALNLDRVYNPTFSVKDFEAKLDREERRKPTNMPDTPYRVKPAEVDPDKNPAAAKNFFAGQRAAAANLDREQFEEQIRGAVKELMQEHIEEVLSQNDMTQYYHVTDATYDDGSPVSEDFEFWDDVLEEAEYQGRDVPLNKPMRGDVKKFKVYVKDPSTGNIKKVNFGDPNMRIKKSNPERRKSFRARHNCDNPGPKTKARYWSCKKW